MFPVLSAAKNLEAAAVLYRTAPFMLTEYGVCVCGGGGDLIDRFVLRAKLFSGNHSLSQVLRAIDFCNPLPYLLCLKQNCM